MAETFYIRAECCTQCVGAIEDLSGCKDSGQGQ